MKVPSEIATVSASPVDLAVAVCAGVLAVFPDRNQTKFLRFAGEFVRRALQSPLFRRCRPQHTVQAEYAHPDRQIICRISILATYLATLSCRRRCPALPPFQSNHVGWLFLFL